MTAFRSNSRLPASRPTRSRRTTVASSAAAERLRGARPRPTRRAMPQRQSDHPVHPLFLDRWSPRAFDGSDLADADLFTIFEAARWAPSAFNSQPWRFLYAKRGDANWKRFLSLLIPWNQGWAHSASVLIYILSDSLPFTDKAGQPAPSLT